jgi:ribonuclease HII
MLRSCYNPENVYEIGVDEAGRGPLFGRLYVAAVLPPLEGFNHSGIRDSKKIKSPKKMHELAAFIKEKSRAFAISYIEHDVIDKINIRQAVFQGMHESIRKCIADINIFDNKTLLLIDGNDFKPFSVFNQETDQLMTLPYQTVEQGDNEYQAIAAASILAKSARDDYIEELCKEFPVLSQRYHLAKNKGYGTPAHLVGILEHGISEWHRVSYARCNGVPIHPVSSNL